MARAETIFRAAVLDVMRERGITSHGLHVMLVNEGFKVSLPTIYNFCDEAVAIRSDTLDAIFKVLGIGVMMPNHRHVPPAQYDYPAEAPRTHARPSEAPDRPTRPTDAPEASKTPARASAKPPRSRKEARK
jgi:hypothetical protein